MAHYPKKNQNDIFEDSKQQRFSRKFRGHRIVGGDSSHSSHRHGWGYLKRRAIFTEEVA